MPSTSPSEYRNYCSMLLREVFARPRMFYNSLQELEMLMIGHHIAFEQLHRCNRKESFHQSFSDWLWKTQGMSGSGGWAYAIDSQTSSGEEADAFFERLVKEFLSQWND